MDDLGDLYGLQGRFDDGERLLQQSLKLIEQAYGSGAQTAPNYDKILNDLGNLYKDAGRLHDAETAFGRALAIGRATRGENHPNVAATIGNLATVMENESRFAEAEDLYKRTLATYEKLIAAINRAKEAGDARAAAVLSPLTATRGCGFLGSRDCWSCLHRDSALKDALAAIAARTNTNP